MLTMKISLFLQTTHPLIIVWSYYTRLNIIHKLKFKLDRNLLNKWVLLILDLC